MGNRAFAMEVRPGTDSQDAPRLREPVAEARSARPGPGVILRALTMTLLCTSSAFPRESAQTGTAEMRAATTTTEPRTLGPHCTKQRFQADEKRIPKLPEPVAAGQTCFGHFMSVMDTAQGGKHPRAKAGWGS